MKRIEHAAAAPWRRFGFLLSRRCIMVFVVMFASAAAWAASPQIEIWRSRQIGRFANQYFRVSVGMASNRTPTGQYTVRKKDMRYWSKKYDRAMPYAVFFTDAHAIHAGDLSTPSRGCVRVNYPTAEFLYHYARTGKTRVFIYP
jgi:lipoprotein-anchoring transpeptidase ErfK/SrfK